MMIIKLMVMCITPAVTPASAKAIFAFRLEFLWSSKNNITFQGFFFPLLKNLVSL